jgi:prefoldin subunit 5
MDSKEFQVINSKVDAIKSELDALRQHILNVEKLIEAHGKKPMW